MGQVLSQSGNRMYQIALVWWLLSNVSEGSGKYIGLFMVACALPSILFVKKIGSQIEKLSGRNILIRSDLMASLLLFLAAMLIYVGLFRVSYIFIFGFLMAILQAFIDPTLNKVVPEVVEKKDVESAVALITSTQSIANFSGAILGAVLIQKLGIWGTVLLAAFGYLFSSFCSYLAAFGKNISEKQESLTAGWGILEDLPFVKKLLIGFACVNFFGSPVLVILPIYTKKTLLGDSSLLGFLEASVWLGLILGAFFSKRIQPKLSQTQLIAICVVFFALGLLIPGVIVNKSVFAISLLLIGMSLGINNVKTMAYFQEIVPNELKGRFFSLMQASISFTFPIAYFLFGAMTDYLNVQTVILIQGLGVLSVALYFFTLKTDKKLEVLA